VAASGWVTSWSAAIASAAASSATGWPPPASSCPKVEPDQLAGVHRVGEHQRDHRAAEQPGGPGGHRVDDLLQRLPVGDRPLDRQQRLQQLMPGPFRGQGAQAAQHQAEHPGHPLEHLLLLRHELLVRPGDDQQPVTRAARRSGRSQVRHDRDHFADHRHGQGGQARGQGRDLLRRGGPPDPHAPPQLTVEHHRADLGVQRLGRTLQRHHDRRLLVVRRAHRREYSVSWWVDQW
jgi:hypothetical protein